ncbi:E1 ubiquitin-activating protein aos1 [Yamadazyma tenuis]|uniref:Ubiquitin-like 1-activating enzyme E1A n=1 Tax=Candida tenuis (strain ATCC 10573 / BCRC 21748 / CBS 615 / JCM 9827 / NBRC 10315 / NRRL Y-1498 / VKM Y-70) TaxID=590646 RepID=G3AYB2_CANTC|nr:uncharacterized protein CANTEDRAFT_133230 [Yamadazyma tenuis ATCC 10573]EGV65810.1 hypothetical protein CANTEDRAFT_133230 [Yamadazyma tenuis ATCC 10573]WEJ95860.1 E1 ubiquitin-activating protein aos1 [Yamadazyma tenuis]
MTSEELSRDEIALYDRQIRLWGIATQLRLRSARLLLINLGSVGMEAVKNLVLGGVNSIELMDNSTIKSEDYGAQFFLPKDDSKIGELKLPNVVDSIKELNDRVEININTKSFDTVIQGDPSYFKKFDLIIATEIQKPDTFKLNELTRELNLPLYIAGTHGMFGYIITDLIDNINETEKDMGNQPRKANTKLNLNKTIIKVESNESTNKELITIHDSYRPIKEIFSSKLLPEQLNKRQLKRLSPSLPLIFALFELQRVSDINAETLKSHALKACEELGVNPDIITDEYLKLFVDQGFTEFAPTSAILGGCLAQDIIQFLSKKESPINNVLIFDGLRSEMPIYTL